MNKLERSAESIHLIDEVVRLSSRKKSKHNKFDLKKDISRSFRLMNKAETAQEYFLLHSDYFWVRKIFTDKYPEYLLAKIQEHPRNY